MIPAIPHIRRSSPWVRLHRESSRADDWQGRSERGVPGRHASERGRRQALPGAARMRTNSRWGPSWKDLEVLVALPVRYRGEVALPLVPLVVLEHLVQAPGHRALNHLVLGEGAERVAEA